MKTWKIATLVAALLLAGASGAALAPMAHAQVTVRSTPRAVELFGARGSQIGVSIRDVGEDDVKAQKLSGPAGVVIEDVSTDSPAEKGGLKKGDVVVEYDGEHVRSARQFTRLVQETPPGRRVQATVMRNGQKTPVTLEPRESNGLQVFGDFGRLRDLGRSFDFDIPVPPTPPAPPAPPAPAFPNFETFVWSVGTTLGITAADLSPQLAEYFGAKHGVLVSSVANDSAAAKAGLKAGDVITAFNGSSVDSPSELRRRIQRLESADEFTIDVVRDKRQTTLKGKTDDRRSTRRYIRSDA